MDKEKDKDRFVSIALWLRFARAVEADRQLLKKAFIASLMLHTVMFFLVIPISCTKEQPVDEEKDVVYSCKPPSSDNLGLKRRTFPSKAAEATPGSLGYIDADAKMDDSSLRNPYPADFNTEEYSTIKENPFLDSKGNPLSTFSIDVDTASYANIRRFLTSGSLPPVDSVRIEEMINYFDYDYPQPEDGHPFSITTELGGCPWNEDHQLALIGLKGKELSGEDRQPSNLVFLIDVSGSMMPDNKLPLLKKCFKLLVEKLDDEDSIAIVVYASAEGVALDATSAKNKKKILSVIDSLESGGCTAGAAGIEKAYRIAEKNFIKGGNNRIILATDGDFNVGISNTSDLVRMIEQKRKKGIYLTILGFGMGNYKDSRMEEMADKGNGNYYYIDNLMEGKKVLVDDLTSTLFTIAKDVKIQVEFNPAKVKAYRLIGYENRMLRKEDFKDDKKDAGELGAGHAVTAIYEIVPSGKDIGLPEEDDLKYQKVLLNDTAAGSDEILTVKFRYKPPTSDKSIEIVKTLSGKAEQFEEMSEDFRFAATVAGFGMMLRDSEHKGNLTYKWLLTSAKAAQGEDEYDYRSEFIRLIKMAKEMDSRQK